MRINLKVPFMQKDEAKRLGARWDGIEKTWYLTDPSDLLPFLPWITSCKGKKTGWQTVLRTMK